MAVVRQGSGVGCEWRVVDAEGLSEFEDSVLYTGVVSTKQRRCSRLGRDVAVEETVFPTNAAVYEDVNCGHCDRNERPYVCGLNTGVDGEDLSPHEKTYCLVLDVK